MEPFHSCAVLSTDRYALTPRTVNAHSQHSMIIATLTSTSRADFAVNWAKSLHALGLRSLVGIAELLGDEAEASLRASGAGLFCADGQAMHDNAQAGRWAEVAPLLATGMDVLLTDADVAFLSSPIPWLSAALHAHPHADALFASDHVAREGYSTATITPHGDGGSDFLDLEGEELVRSFDPAQSLLNIGVLFLRGRRNRTTSRLVQEFARAVEEVEELSAQPVRADHVHGSAGGSNGQEGMPHRAGAYHHRLVSWDQKPIDSVLQRGWRPHAHDEKLALVFHGQLALGVFPMLQFTTAFTYFVSRPQLERGHPVLARAPPILIHSIFTHGSDAARKRATLREAGGWHDPPSYYDGRFLAVAPRLPRSCAGHLPGCRDRLSSAPAEVGYDVILSHQRRVRAGLALALALNRTLVLPRLVCGERPLAAECYAWYHRASLATYKDGRHSPPPEAEPVFPVGGGTTIPMPPICPVYYWVKDFTKLGQLRHRESTFLSSKRTPASLVARAVTLQLRSTGSSSAAQPVSTPPPAAPLSAGRVVELPLDGVDRAASRAGLLATLSTLKAQLLYVKAEDIDRLVGDTLAGSGAASAGGGADTGSASRDFLDSMFADWCSVCPVGRKRVFVRDMSIRARRRLEAGCVAGARTLLTEAARRCERSRGERKRFDRPVTVRSSPLGVLAPEGDPIVRLDEQSARGGRGRTRNACELQYAPQLVVDIAESIDR